MNEREFRRRHNQREEDRVLGQMKKDSDAAKEMEQQLGMGIPILGRKNDPVPSPTLGERLSEPVQVPASVSSLADKRKEKDARPETVGDSRFYAVDLGHSKPGQPEPTHVILNGITYLMIPHEHFDGAVDMAFQRGYQRCLEVYGPTHQIMNVPPVIDSLQKSYCQLVIEGFYK